MDRTKWFPAAPRAVQLVWCLYIRACTRRQTGRLCYGPYYFPIGSTLDPYSGSLLTELTQRLRIMIIACLLYTQYRFPFFQFMDTQRLSVEIENQNNKRRKEKHAAREEVNGLTGNK